MGILSVVLILGDYTSFKVQGLQMLQIIGFYWWLVFIEVFFNKLFRKLILPNIS